MQFFGWQPGVLGVSFPYSVTDSSGATTDHVFSGEKKDIYGSHKAYVAPILIELGHLHHFVNFGIALIAIKEELAPSAYLTAGYGLIWFADPLRGSRRRFEDRRWGIKASLNLTYSADGPGTSSAVFGTIDNYHKTIYLLGEEADPTYTTGDGTRRYPYKTHIAHTLRVSYSQRELSLLPRISFAANPYHGHGHERYELIVGYTIPVIERGGLYFQQVADGDPKGISNAVNLNNEGIVASYDHRPIRSTPYHFGGLFTGILLSIGKSKEIVR